MKGIALTLFLAVILVAFFIVVAGLMPFFVTKVHMERLVLLELRDANANTALISLLSSTETDTLDGQTKRVSKIIAENISFTNSPDMNFLGPMLDKLVRSNIYKLFYINGGGEVILVQSGNPSGRTGQGR